MPIPKRPEQVSGKTTPLAPASIGERKPWKKKSPVEVVLEQEVKLKQEIAQGEEELKHKRSQLTKFEQARKIFEES